MQGTLFFDGMDVQLDDIQNVETTKSAELKRRLIDIAYQSGIIAGLTVSQTVGYTLTVGIGSAYDGTGEYIGVGASTAQLLATADAGRYLVVQYRTVDSQNVEHPVTGAFYPTRRTDNYQLMVVATPSSATDVILARIVAVDVLGFATLDLTVRKYWGARLADGSVTDAKLDPNGAVMTRVHAHGTGVVTPNNPDGLTPADIGFVADPTAFEHQALDHISGIEADSNPNTAKVTVDLTTAPDQLLVTQLGLGDNILINGTRITAPTPLAPTIVTVTDGGVAPGVYEVSVDNTGLVQKALRAVYTTARLTTGVFIVDFSTNHTPGSCTLLFSAAGPYLQWNGGPIQMIDVPSGTFSGDKFYTLRRGTDETQWIKVWVDYSSIPLTNVSDTVVVGASSVTINKLLLAYVPWSGSLTGFLGYGDEYASGSAYDKRPFGNLGVKNLANSLYELEFRTRMSETRANGFVVLRAIAPIGLNVTLPYSVAYVRGKRFEIASATVAVTDNATTYAWLDDTGVWRFTDYDPTATNINQPIPLAMGWQFVATSGVVTATDLRVDIRDPDSGNVKTTRPNTFVKPQTFNGDASDQDAALRTTQVPTARKLLWEAATAGTVKMRLYVGAAKTFAITINAWWNAADSKWYSDTNTQNSSRIMFGQGTIQTFGKTAGPANWSDGSWDQVTLSVDYIAQTFTWAAALTVSSLAVSGSVSAANATFSGAVAAASVSASGTVSGATGSFTNVTASLAVAAGTTLSAGTDVLAQNGLTFGRVVYTSVGADFGPHIQAGVGAVHNAYWSRKDPSSLSTKDYGIAAPFRCGIQSYSAISCQTVYPTSWPAYLVAPPIAVTGVSSESEFGVQVVWTMGDVASGGNNGFDLAGLVTVS